MKITAVRQGKREEWNVREGESLLALLQRNNGQVSAPCGGHGKCGKCRVPVEAGGQRREVLSCQYYPSEGDLIFVDGEERLEVLNKGAVTDDIVPDTGMTGYGIACDIGTTTVACQLVRLSDGKVLAVRGKGNAQRPYGADVIARITAAESGRLETLQKAIVDQLNRMIGALCGECGISPEEVTAVTAAGNPTMCHLLTGLDPSGIGRAPFTPASYFGEERDAERIGLCVRGRLYILPSVSGYVGGDITADMLAVGMDRQEKPVLLIDVGTNGEMVLGGRDRMICCSTAAGPAFEGAQITCGMTAAPGAVSSVEWTGSGLKVGVIGSTGAKGICGSGLIDAVAVMLELGVLEDTGRLLDPEEDEEDIPPKALPYLFLTEDEEPAFRLTDSVYVTQGDIRRLQLGKGAIAAGEQVLLKRFGASCEEIGSLLLAGGFGSYIRPESAARIGMIPEELLSVTGAVGNTALEGAREALISHGARARLSAMKERMEYLELSGSRMFNDFYIEAMMFPEED